MPDQPHESERQLATQGVSLALKRMIFAISAANEAAGRSQNLQPTDYNCLMYLAECGAPVSPKDLVKAIGLTSGAVTGLVDRLEHKGYLSRSPNPDDRRGTLITLDEARGAGFVTAFTEIQAGFESSTAPMSVHELEIVTRFLGYVSDLAHVAKRTIEMEDVK